MQLFQLKEPKLLQAAIETEEQRLRLYHISHSSARTMEVVVTTEETTGTTTSDMEDNSSNNDNITPPTPHDG